MLEETQHDGATTIPLDPQSTSPAYYGYPKVSSHLTQPLVEGLDKVPLVVASGTQLSYIMRVSGTNVYVMDQSTGIAYFSPDYTLEDGHSYLLKRQQGVVQESVSFIADGGKKITEQGKKITIYVWNTVYTTTTHLWNNKATIYEQYVRNPFRRPSPTQTLLPYTQQDVPAH